MKYCQKAYAIIPARGGSKGLIRKNIKLLARKPLIVYSIEAGLHCSKISRVIVSTEDPDVKKVSLEWGAEVIDRPMNLATDTALTRDVVLHVLETLRKEKELPECFALLQPTSPFRNSMHLESCLDLFFKSKAACVISVTEVECHPYKTLRLESSYLRPLFDVNYLDQPRQRLLPIYRQNGAIYAMKTDSFLNVKRFFVEPAMPFFMSRETSIDIDTELDFLVANAILNQADPR